MTTSDTIDLTDASFETDVLRADLPVLVDFWGEGCGGCRQIAPAINALAREYAGRVRVGKLDVSSNSATALRYGIRTIPSLLLFRHGRVVAQTVGVIGAAGLRKMMDPHL